MKYRYFIRIDVMVKGVSISSCYDNPFFAHRAMRMHNTSNRVSDPATLAYAVVDMHNSLDLCTCPSVGAANAIACAMNADHKAREVRIQQGEMSSVEQMTGRRMELSEIRKRQKDAEIAYRHSKLDEEDGNES